MAKKKLTVEVRKTKRQLKCVLTKDELLAKGKRQAERKIELDAIEADKKQMNDEFKFRASAVEAELGTLANAINSGTEFREVEVEERWGEPEPGKKTIVRLDTHETLGVEFLSSGELQRELIEKEEAAEE